jgi:putative Ig domain-containing protein
VRYLGVRCLWPVRQHRLRNSGVVAMHQSNVKFLPTARAVATAVFLVAAMTLASIAEAGTERCRPGRRENPCLSPNGGSGSNGAPTISGTPATSASMGQVYSFTPTASDPDRNPLVFRIANRPNWATFSRSTGQLTGTPTASSVGQYNDIRISVNDGYTHAWLAPFSIVVAQGNRPPSISGASVTAVAVGQAYVFTPSASDPEGNALTFSIVNRPSWATFSSSSGRLAGTPAAGSAGQYNDIRISVNDGQAGASLAPFNLSVTQDNRPPTISGTPGTAVTVGQAYAFTPTAADPDGTALTFSITNQPAWASFSSSTGRLSGTPTAGSVGQSNDIRISVSDGQLSASLASFGIAVTQNNRPPTISGTPATSVTTGQTYTFTPTASDPDGNPLTFSIVNRPPWASFSTANGRLTGVPTSASAAQYVDIRINVSDGQANAALAPFFIDVNQANRPPTIGGSPPTAAREGQAYAFTPSANDADGNTLTFTIANRPGWASFNSTTGALTGTPGLGTVGNYANITIGVGDGTATAALPAFAIAVAQASMGSATLSWQAPTTRTDGTPLTNLDGYRIRYGTAVGSYPNMIDVANGSLTSAVISNLPPGTYYFVISAYDTTGAESSNAGPASKTIN